ncbi:MAG: hypothetical protein ACRCX4_04795 [Bacteroidales bacterium]
MKKNKIKEALDAFHALSQEDKKAFFSSIVMRQSKESSEKDCVIYLKKRRKMDKIVLNEIAVVVREDRKMKIVDMGNKIAGIYSTSISDIKSQIQKTEMANFFYCHRTFMISLRVFQDIPSYHLSTVKVCEVLLRFGIYVCSATARNIRDFVLESRR